MGDSHNMPDGFGVVASTPRQLHHEPQASYEAHASYEAWAS